MGILKRTVLTALALCLFSSCSTVGYVVDQGIGQWRLLNQARPVEEILQSPYTDAQTKWAIEKVQVAKQFAVQELGLKATSNYKKYVKLDGPYVTYVVSSADALKLESRTWQFPIIGNVPYLGFFSKQKAQSFAEKLKRDSAKPDVWMRGVPAFSSLGWFPDPLYSSMIEKSSEADIYDLVIHESLHATVWVGDSVDFNESLANFVGLRGSQLLLSRLYPPSNGRESSKIIDAKADFLWEQTFASFIEAQIEKYKREVDSFEKKEKFYSDLSANWESFYKAKIGGIAPKRNPQFLGWNNAALLSYGNYYRDYGVFEKVLLKCKGDLAQFIAWIARETKKGGLMQSSPLERLAVMGENESCVFSN